jgi:hypothetical protein
MVSKYGETKKIITIENLEQNVQSTISQIQKYRGMFDTSGLEPQNLLEALIDSLVCGLELDDIGPFNREMNRLIHSTRKSRHLESRNNLINHCYQLRDDYIFLSSELQNDMYERLRNQL